MNSTLRKIIFLLGDDRKKIPILLTMFVFSSIGDLIGIALIGPYVSLIIEGGSDLYAIVAITEFFNIYEGDVVIYLGLALVGVFFVKSVVLILVNRYIFNFSSNRQASLRAYLLKSYQNMPYETFLSKNSSEYIHTIQQLTQEYVNTLRYALRSASDGVVVILIFLIIAWKSPLTVLGIILTIVVLIFTYDILFKSKQNQYGLVVNSAMRQIIKSVNESISGFKEIRILGKEEYFYQIVSKSSFTYSKNHSKSLLINSSPRYLLELLVVVFIVTFVSLASGRNEGATEIVSMLAIFGVAAMRVLPAASIISSFIGLLRYNKDGIDKLHNAYSMSKSYTSLNKSDKFKKDAFASIKFLNVSFSYEKSKISTINNISFNINAGDTIGFIGKSGSGKTTIVDLMLGLLKPTSGSIKYNNQSIEKCLSIWRAKVAYLPQDSLLIDDTLQSNIALGEKNIDNKRLIESLRQARILDFVDNLPEGVHTVVGERGMRISGGQRQRIAIARAFYNDREILVFDEATSALDGKTEKEIVDEIKHLKGMKTIVVISHKLTTLKHCDIIYEIKDGLIKDAHKYNDLVRI